MDIRNEIAKHKIDNRGQTYVPLTLALRIANERVNRKREEDAREIEALEMIQGVLEDALLDVMPLVKRFNFTLWVTTMRRIGAVIDPRVMHELVGLEEPGMVTRQYENRPQLGMRHIESLVMHPAGDLSAAAMEHAGEMPRSVRALLRTMGAASEMGGQLTSYLLFETGYTSKLIGMGYDEAQLRREEIGVFLGL